MNRIFFSPCFHLKLSFSTSYKTAVTLDEVEPKQFQRTVYEHPRGKDSD